MIGFVIGLIIGAQVGALAMALAEVASGSDMKEEKTVDH